MYCEEYIFLPVYRRLQHNRQNILNFPVKNKHPHGQGECVNKRRANSNGRGEGGGIKAPFTLYRIHLVPHS